MPDESTHLNEPCDDKYKLVSFISNNINQVIFERTMYALDVELLPQCGLGITVGEYVSTTHTQKYEFWCEKCNMGFGRTIDDVVEHVRQIHIGDK